MASVKMSPEMTKAAIEVATLKKGLDTAKMQGEAAVDLIESAGEVVEAPRVRANVPHLGQMIDVYM